MTPTTKAAIDAAIEPPPEPAKSLGQIAYEAAYKDMGETYPWERVPAEEHGHWEAAAQAVTRAAALAKHDLEVRVKEARRLAEAVRVGSALNAAYHAAWIDGEADRIEAGSDGEVRSGK